MAKPATLQIKLVSTADTGFLLRYKKEPSNKTRKIGINEIRP
ncbi:MAG: hypothetical protein CM15mP117_01400 [Alphaproteobacteria bacterium]|nr:MAG: hypothetical protein CM15mP117_01400 [Alphaproteobacteria bacterium]